MVWLFWHNFFAFLWPVNLSAYLLPLHQITCVATILCLQLQVRISNKFIILRPSATTSIPSCVDSSSMSFNYNHLDTFPSIWNLCESQTLNSCGLVYLWILRSLCGPEQVWVLQEHICPPFSFSGAEDMIKSNKKLNSQDGATNAIISNNVNKQVNSLALFSQPNAPNR